jgi:hypothetical protein
MELTIGCSAIHRRCLLFLDCRASRPIVDTFLPRIGHDCQAASVLRIILARKMQGGRQL